MKKPAIIVLLILLIIGLAFFAKDKFRCFMTNYQLQHNDIKVVESDSAAYMKQFDNRTGKAEYQLSLIEFGGQGCKPCMRMDTVLHDIAQIYGYKLNLKIIRLTTRGNRKIARYFGIREIPVQVILNQEGKEVFRHTGFLSKEELQLKIKKLKNQ